MDVKAMVDKYGVLDNQHDGFRDHDGRGRGPAQAQGFGTGLLDGLQARDSTVRGSEQVQGPGQHLPPAKVQRSGEEGCDELERAI